MITKRSGQVGLRFGLGILLVCGVLAGGDGVVLAQNKSQLDEPTHRQIRVIEPEVDGEKPRLHTIATTSDGGLLAAVGGKSMQFVMNPDSAMGYETKMIDEPGHVLLLDPEGQTLEKWELDLTPSAMAVAPDGTVFVGGSGRIAKLDDGGGIALTIDSPHVGSVDEMREKTKKSILDSRKMMAGSFDSQIEVLQERIDIIEEKDEDDRSALELAQLKAFQTQLEMLEKLSGDSGDDEDDEDDESIDPTELDTAMMRAMSVTSMAASEKDLFLCAMDPSQGGYSVWRINHDLDPESSELIMEGLRGCCGQMDIQCCGDDLVVSENTKFRVGIYDRNGRTQGSFGRRDRTSRSGFGSCCNPMNSLSLSDGTILTAESSIGHIKRFDTDGNLVAYIGKAKIGGGCKHCALGYDEANDLYYMMYEEKNAICVMANSESTPMTLAEKETQQREIDFLARAAGHWSIDDGKDEEEDGGAVSSLLTIFGGGRGGSSQYPVSSLKIGSDGTAKILEGMYKAYGDKSELELLEESGEKSADNSDAVGFALAIDQVRFLEGTWKFDDDETATLAFTGHSPIKMKRVADAEECDTECGGAKCTNENCTEKGCPKARKTSINQLAATKPERELLLEADMEADMFESELSFDLGSIDPADLETMMFSAPMPSPTYEYKLLTKKQLGDAAEERLNELGAEGWDYCGQLGKKLMFKRMSGMVMNQAETK